MARLARVVAPGVAYHLDPAWESAAGDVLQRGDYMACLELMVNLLRGHERTGRPLGSAAFVKRLDSRLDRLLHRKPPGRKPKTMKK